MRIEEIWQGEEKEGRMEKEEKGGGKREKKMEK